ncbi:hypothetical protein DVH05_025977 [Phytophthora capsici]|nr:hypothetical protein DVH05_025977 [Phytophthora capsici]
MNCQLSDVVLTTARSPSSNSLVLPDILKNSPLLGKVQALSKKNEDSKKKKSGKTQGRKGGRRKEA